jgi:putative chitinase
MPITAAQLAAAAPRVDVSRWLVPLNDAMDEFQINSPARIAGFIGQCGHESADFTRLVENMNYSADGLANTWPTRYSNGTKNAAGRWLPNSLANLLQRNPPAIANNVYANRMGNGSEASGDGWRYRGRGLIQLTGLANIAEASRELGVDYVQNPALLEEPVHAARASAWWCLKNRILPIFDKHDWLAASRAVNIGNANSQSMPHGHEDRRTRTLVALDAFTSGPSALA